jgi:hypothetical protein
MNTIGDPDEEFLTLINDIDSDFNQLFNDRMDVVHETPRQQHAYNTLMVAIIGLKTKARLFHETPNDDGTFAFYINAVVYDGNIATNISLWKTAGGRKHKSPALLLKLFEVNRRRVMLKWKNRIESIFK